MARYIWPVNPGTSINQPFGSSPGGVNPAGGHTGMDFGTEIGTPVYAPAAGVIEYAQNFTTTNGSDNPYWITDGGGISVVLGCDGDDAPSFVFSHLNSTSKNRGDRVEQGDVIGYSGNTGRWTTGAHLHFEAIPPGYNLNSNTYGRINPNRYCTGYKAAAAQSNDITPITPKPSLEETLAKLDKDDYINIAKAVWSGPGSWVTNRRLGKKEYAETTLGSLEDRVIRQQLTPLRAEVAALNATMGVLAKTVGGDPTAITKAVTAAVNDSLKNLEATVKLEAK